MRHNRQSSYKINESDVKCNLSSTDLGGALSVVRSINDVNLIMIFNEAIHSSQPIAEDTLQAAEVT